MTLPVLHLDFETRSEIDLKVVGLHRYARHPSTDVWCAAMAVNDAEPVCYPVVGSKAFPWDLLDMAAKRQCIVVSHNAPFELEIWNEILASRYGWPKLPVENVHCTMAMSYAMGMPGALEDAALAYGLQVLKDTEGRALMLRMARPRSLNPTTWWDSPDKLARLYEYCRQDVRVERELYKRLMPLSDRERAVWLLDYRINKRGVQADVETALAALDMARKVKEAADQRMAELTGGQVQTCNALIPLKAWLDERGCPATATGLDKQTANDLLATHQWKPEVTEALLLRQEASKASTSKLDRITEQVGVDGRLRNLFQYHGAAPGRWTGRGVQPHNFVRDVPSPHVVERVFHYIRKGEIDAVGMIYGPPLEMLSRSMRGIFTAAPGNVLVGADFTNVEGRGQAWVSREAWKLAAFRAADNGAGPGIYELTASKILGTTPDAITKEQRQAYGKVPELALGFAGGKGAFQKMAKTYGVKIPDLKAEEIKIAWRAEHPNIALMWKALNSAAINAVRSHGDEGRAGSGDRVVRYKMVGSFLWCLLPSGRTICYPYPKILAGAFGPMLTYMTEPGLEDTTIDDPQNRPRWMRVTTHGGPLMQNVVSGICRDLLAEAMLKVDAAKLDIVLHVHDDLNVEVSEKHAEVAKHILSEAMNTPPEWAKGFPLVAKAKIMRRYSG